MVGDFKISKVCKNIITRKISYIKSTLDKRKSVVKKFKLADRKKRNQLRKGYVLPHCKKELIVLHTGETLLH